MSYTHVFERPAGFIHSANAPHTKTAPEGRAPFTHVVTDGLLQGQREPVFFITFCFLSVSSLDVTSPWAGTLLPKPPSWPRVRASNTHLMRGGMQESWKVFHSAKMNGLLRSLLPGTFLPESFPPGVFLPGAPLGPSHLGSSHLGPSYLGCSSGGSQQAQRWLQLSKSFSVEPPRKRWYFLVC